MILISICIFLLIAIIVLVIIRYNLLSRQAEIDEEIMGFDDEVNDADAEANDADAASEANDADVEANDANDETVNLEEDVHSHESESELDSEQMTSNPGCYYRDHVTRTYKKVNESEEECKNSRTLKWFDPNVEADDEGEVGICRFYDRTLKTVIDAEMKEKDCIDKTQTENSRWVKKPFQDDLQPVTASPGTTLSPPPGNICQMISGPLGNTKLTWLPNLTTKSKCKDAWIRTQFPDAQQKVWSPHGKRPWDCDGYSYKDSEPNSPSISDESKCAVFSINKKNKPTDTYNPFAPEGLERERSFESGNYSYFRAMFDDKYVLPEYYDSQLRSNGTTIDNMKLWWRNIHSLIQANNGSKTEAKDKANRQWTSNANLLSKGKKSLVNTEPECKRRCDADIRCKGFNFSSTSHGNLTDTSKPCTLHTDSETTFKKTSGLGKKYYLKNKQVHVGDTTQSQNEQPDPYFQQTKNHQRSADSGHKLGLGMPEKTTLSQCKSKCNMKRQPPLGDMNAQYRSSHCSGFDWRPVDRYDKSARAKGECVLWSDYVKTVNGIQGRNIVAPSIEAKDNVDYYHAVNDGCNANDDKCKEERQKYLNKRNATLLT